MAYDALEAAQLLSDAEFWTDEMLDFVIRALGMEKFTSKTQHFQFEQILMMFRCWPSNTNLLQCWRKFIFSR